MLPQCFERSTLFGFELFVFLQARLNELAQQGWRKRLVRLKTNGAFADGCESLQLVLQRLNGAAAAGIEGTVISGLPKTDQQSSLPEYWDPVADSLFGVRREKPDLLSQFVQRLALSQRDASQVF